MLDRLRIVGANPAMRSLAVGKGVSYLGDWLMVAALVAWVYETSGSVAQVSLLMVIRLVPPIVGAGVAAAVVDRVPRKHALVAAELACAFAVGLALVAVLGGWRLGVFAAAGLCGLIAMVANVAGNALIPSIVRREQLPAANAVYSVAQELAMAVGALAGGVLMATVGVAPALLANLVSYVVATVLYARIRVDEADASTTARKACGLRDGARYLAARRPLLAVVAGFALATTATGLTNASLPRFFDALGMGTGAYGYGLAALAGGLVLGELAAGTLRRVDSSVVAGSLAAMAICFAAFASAGSPVAALALLALVGVANGVAEIALMTTVQTQADPAYHGRVFGLSSSVFRTTMVSAMAAAPLVNALATPREAVVVSAVCLALGAVAVFAMRTPAQRVVTQPA